jgi:hypothetical protein
MIQRDTNSKVSKCIVPIQINVFVSSSYRCLCIVLYQGVGKCIVPIQEIVPLPTVTKGKVISSEERKPDSDTKMIRELGPIFHGAPP